MFIFIIISDEREQKSYSQIKLLYSKGEKKSLAHTYYSNYIGYKFRKLAGGRGNLQQQIIERNKFESFREKYQIRIISSMAIPLTITDFCAKTNLIWNNYAKDTLDGCQDLNQVFSDFNNFCCETTLDFHNKVAQCMKSGFQMANLAYMILFCGGLFSINSYDLIKGFKFVSVRDYNVKCREFQVKYYTRVKADIDDKRKFNYTEDGSVNYIKDEDYDKDFAFSDYSDSMISASNVDMESRCNSNYPFF